MLPRFQPFNVQFRNVLDEAPLGVALDVTSLGHQPDHCAHRHLTIDLEIKQTFIVV